jgi:hypothetical protein
MGALVYQAVLGNPPEAEDEHGLPSMNHERARGVLIRIPEATYLVLCSQRLEHLLGVLLYRVSRWTWRSQRRVRTPRDR